jgi:hypothetical protein
MKRCLILMTCFLGACTSNDRKERTEEGQKVKDVRVIDTTSSIGGCYTAILKNDTSDLVLQHKKGASSVSGDLSIKNFEKDSNKGTFNGKIEGDLIVAWYDFFSEGKGSVRQIVFKVRGDTLLEGYGNLINKGDSDTIIFDNIGALKYLMEKPYVKRDCK